MPSVRELIRPITSVDERIMTSIAVLFSWNSVRSVGVPVMLAVAAAGVAPVATPVVIAAAAGPTGSVSPGSVVPVPCGCKAVKILVDDGSTEVCNAGGYLRAVHGRNECLQGAPGSTGLP